MNYRHAYHAGNYADVFKHIILIEMLDYLRQKDKPFFVLDTHAGIGLYDLHGEEAGKTGEAVAGIGKLWDRRDAPAPVAAYLAQVRGLTNGRKKGELRYYPGSPLLIRTLLRPQDRLVANELHPADNKTLRDTLGDDPRLRVEQRDGYELLRSQLPPSERRGLVLVDPPFEVKDEFARLLQGVRDARARWETGIYALWYPIKDMRPVEEFLASLRALGIPKMLAAHFMIRPANDPALFNGCGLVLINPPWTLHDSILGWGPWLAQALAPGEAFYTLKDLGNTA